MNRNIPPSPRHRERGFATSKEGTTRHGWRGEKKEQRNETPQGKKNKPANHRGNKKPEGVSSGEKREGAFQGGGKTVEAKAVPNTTQQKMSKKGGSCRTKRRTWCGRTRRQPPSKGKGPQGKPSNYTRENRIHRPPTGEGGH